MRTADHLLLGQYLLAHYAAPALQRHRRAFLLGCVEPDWKDRSLLAPGSVATPIDAIKSKLTAGEIDELYIEIQMLSGYIDRALADVKNA